MKILAIETSCDETAIAILEATGPLKNPNFRILSSVVFSQIKIHEPFGGVVPNLAMREHQKNLVPTLVAALHDAQMLKGKNRQLRVGKKLINKTKLVDTHKTQIKKISLILSREYILLGKLQKFIKQYETPDIDAIAVTNGPGLEPALWVGINFAKALSAIWRKPIIPINHLEGHIYAGFMPKTQNAAEGFWLPAAKEIFPALALIVSGGHTELVLIKKHLNYRILGETRDDAAGEAFDKVAKMLKLGYPGGPEISKIAEHGNPVAIEFPRPMIHSNDFDFSFAGLKTAVLYYIKERSSAFENSLTPSRTKSKLYAATARPHLEFPSAKSISFKANIAASFEQAVVDVLVAKTAKALKTYKIKSLVVGGGVVANKKLRSSLGYMIKLFPETTLHLSPLWLTGDNAAMIALPAYLHLLKKGGASTSKQIKLLSAQGNLEL